MESPLYSRPCLRVRFVKEALVCTLKGWQQLQRLHLQKEAIRKLEENGGKRAQEVQKMQKSPLPLEMRAKREREGEPRGKKHISNKNNHKITTKKIARTFCPQTKFRFRLAGWFFMCTRYFVKNTQNLFFKSLTSKWTILLTSKTTFFLEDLAERD